MDTESTIGGRAIPWNKGKLLGQKPPLKLKEIWAIRWSRPSETTVADRPPAVLAPRPLMRTHMAQRNRVAAAARSTGPNVPN
jgi:hypothetical protein